MERRARRYRVKRRGDVQQQIDLSTTATFSVRSTVRRKQYSTTAHRRGAAECIMKIDGAQSTLTKTMYTLDSGNSCLHVRLCFRGCTAAVPGQHGHKRTPSPHTRAHSGDNNSAPRVSHARSG
eukprot:6193703-Pleurochrysis_carterae.AAC.1